MADYRGAYADPVPVISMNTAAILRHRCRYANGATAINLPLVKGTRYIIYGLVSAGKDIDIGFGQSAGTITDSRFTYSQAAGPTDLSGLFNAAPFSQYVEPSATMVYLIITSDAEVSIAYAEFKG